MGISTESGVVITYIIRWLCHYWGTSV